MILFLGQLTDADGPEAGSKALGLARLARAGLSVPPGFCITGEAYRAHVAPLREEIERILAAPSDAAPLLDALRRGILGEPVAPAVSAAIEESWRALGASAAAVRSSSTTEDLAGHAGAGLHDSFLDVRSVEECVGRVRDCWASMWSDRAFAYRRARGIPHDGAMAVLVQEQVEADFGGVAFAVEPVSGNPDVIVLESVQGCGDALAAGRVTPERIIVRKRDRKIVYRKTPAGTRALPGAMVAALARTVRAVEPAFGGDLEWAARRGKLHVLQARPVTAAKKWDPKNAKIWSNANVGEVVPGVVSPMGWSLALVFVRWLFNDNMRRLGVDMGPDPPLRLIAGRAYFELTMLTAILRSVPGMGAIDVNTIFGGHQKRLLGGIPILPDETTAPMRLDWPKLLVQIPRFALASFAFSEPRGRTLLDSLREKGRTLLCIDLAALDEREILESVRRIMDGLFTLTGAFELVGAGISYLNSFLGVCRRWLNDEGGALANRLLAGTGALDSAEPGLELWRMAAFMRAHPELERLAGKSGPFSPVRAGFEGLEEGRAFLERWDAFMERHGHHAQGEVDVANPRWSERPDYILDVMRSYLPCLAEADPVAHHRRLSEEHEALMRECLGRLRNPLARPLFRFLAGKAVWGMAQREGFKSEAVRQLAAIRFHLLALGERLASRGALEKRDDVFFLAFDELEPALRSPADFDARAHAAERRAEHERNLTLDPPPVIIGAFDETALPAMPEHAVGEELTGQSVSSGVVQGRARVMTRTGEEQSVQPGEILVIPCADPGWTPYFMPAAGIVMDMGGILSHGCIIAREYGIPAVVNVGCATTLIRSGQIVRVDADRGVVTVLGDGSDEPAG